jgi:hypothetical protein
MILSPLSNIVGKAGAYSKIGDLSEEASTFANSFNVE